MRNRLLKLTFILALVTIAGITFAPSRSIHAINVFNSTAGSSGHCVVTANRITIPIGDDYILNSVIVSGVGSISIHEDSAGTIGTLIETLGSGAGVPLTPSSTVTLIGGNSYWIRSGNSCWAIAASAPTGIFSLTGSYWSLGAASSNGYAMSIDASVVVPISNPVIIPTDGRLNPELADDTEVVLYPAFDFDGNRTIQAYCVSSESLGYLGLVITETDLLTSAPTQNTLLLESDICDIEFWTLADGSEFRYQLNVGPNADGTVTELLFNDINAGGLEMRSFNLYQLGD